MAQNQPDSSLLTATVLVAVAFAMLPVWDAVSRYQMLSAMSGAFGSGSGAPIPPAGVGYPLAAVALGYGIYRGFHRARTMGWALYALGVAVVVMYAGATGLATALTRSHAVDGWAVCETGERPGGGKAFLSAHKRTPAFDGPHLESGEPCTQLAEAREAHLRAHPGGDVLDGLVQIWKRFPRDRLRVLWGSVAAGAMLVAAGVLLRNRQTGREGQVSEPG
jgi:hypothetical protein